MEIGAFSCWHIVGRKLVKSCGTVRGWILWPYILRGERISTPAGSIHYYGCLMSSPEGTAVWLAAGSSD